jgi:hypothetical protein
MPPRGRDDRRVPEKDEAAAFEEAERALAILQGKDPVIVAKSRVLRGRDAEAEARKAEEERALRREKLSRLLRKVIIGVVAVALVTGATMLLLSAREQRDEALRLLDPMSRPLLAAGFRLDNLVAPRGARAQIEKDIDGCVIAMAADAEGPVPLDVTFDEQTTHGERGVAVCSCGPAKLLAKAEGRDGRFALALYHAPGALTGGTKRLAAAFPDLLVKETSPDCAETQLDAWLGQRGKAQALATAEGAQGPVVEALKLRGLRVVGWTPDGASMLPVAIAAGECALVIAARPILRGAAGVRLAEGADGGIAFCTSKDEVKAVVPSTPGPVMVLAAKADVADGVLGLAEIARAAGVKGAIASYLPKDLLAPHALDLVKKSTGAGAVVETFPDDPQARVVVIARAATDEPLDVAPLTCEPPVGKGIAESICIVPPGQRWVSRAARPVMALAPLPVWLRALAEVTDPNAHHQALRVLSLGRRLVRQGFDPTILESVKETFGGGVEISGRQGEDRVIAVGLGPKPPYAVPLSNAAPWTLDGEPTVMPLAPGKRINIRNALLVPMPLDARRTLVFRAKPASP